MADQLVNKDFGSSTGPGLSRIICNPAESWAMVKAIKTMPRFSGNIRRHFLRTLKNDGAEDMWRKLGASAIGDELEVEAHLGKGTFGTVKKVLHKRSGKHFALKEVRNAQDDLNYHLQLLEMTALTGVQGCDHIVKVIAMDDRRPEAPILLELCSGTLQEAVFGSNPLQCSFPDMLRFMGEVAKGLVFCHEQGFVHGDLKAANILLSKQESPGDTAGATLCAKVADFGLSMRTGTMRGPGRGTPGNVPPEVCQDYALASGCQDVFGVGSTLASMCSKAELRRWNIFISSILDNDEERSERLEIRRRKDSDPTRRFSFEARMAFRTMGDGSASRHYIVPKNMRSDLPEAVEVCRDMARMIDVDPDNRPTMTEVSNLCQYWAFLARSKTPRVADTRTVVTPPTPPTAASPPSSSDMNLDDLQAELVALMESSASVNIGVEETPAAAVGLLLSESNPVIANTNVPANAPNTTAATVTTTVTATINSTPTAAIATAAAVESPPSSAALNLGHLQAELSALMRSSASMDVGVGETPAATMGLLVSGGDTAAAAAAAAAAAVSVTGIAATAAPAPTSLILTAAIATAIVAAPPSPPWSAAVSFDHPRAQPSAFMRSSASVDVGVGETPAATMGLLVSGGDTAATTVSVTGTAATTAPAPTSLTPAAAIATTTVAAPSSPPWSAAVSFDHPRAQPSAFMQSSASVDAGTGGASEAAMGTVIPDGDSADVAFHLTRAPMTSDYATPGAVATTAIVVTTAAVVASRPTLANRYPIDIEAEVLALMDSSASVDVGGGGAPGADMDLLTTGGDPVSLSLPPTSPMLLAKVPSPVRRWSAFGGGERAPKIHPTRTREFLESTITAAACRNASPPPVSPLPISAVVLNIVDAEESSASVDDIKGGAPAVVICLANVGGSVAHVFHRPNSPVLLAEAPSPATGLRPSKYHQHDQDVGECLLPGPPGIAEGGIEDSSPTPYRADQSIRVLDVSALERDMLRWASEARAENALKALLGMPRGAAQATCQSPPPAVPAGDSHPHGTTQWQNRPTDSMLRAALGMQTLHIAGNTVPRGDTTAAVGKCGRYTKKAGIFPKQAGGSGPAGRSHRSRRSRRRRRHRRRRRRRTKLAGHDGLGSSSVIDGSVGGEWSGTQHQPRVLHARRERGCIDEPGNGAERGGLSGGAPVTVGVHWGMTVGRT